MKVWFDPKSDLQGLRSKVLRDGDRIALYKENAELVIPSSFMLPQETLSMLGFETSSSEPKYTVSKWWNGKAFSPQLLVGVPLLRQMNDNLGPAIAVGSAARFVQTFECESDFEIEALESLLRESKYQGFVTLAYETQSVSQVHIGLPFGLPYNLLEAIPGKLSQWYTHPGRLVESWSCSLLVTRPWFPCKPEAPEIDLRFDRTGSQFPESDPLLHFHPFALTSTRIGYVTSWARSLHQASERVLDLARMLQVKDKMYRTDLEQVARRTWTEITKLEFV